MLGEPQACSLKYLADKKFQLKTVEYPEGETMHLLDRAVLPTSVPPCLTPPRRKRHALNTLKVVFSTNGDLIKVHSYGDATVHLPYDTCISLLSNAESI